MWKQLVITSDTMILIRTFIGFHKLDTVVFALRSSWFPGFITNSFTNTDPELDFPEQLTADNISFSYTVNDRLFEHVDVVISWEKPEGRILCL